MELEQVNQIRASLLELELRLADLKGRNRPTSLNGVTHERIAAAVRRLEQGTYGYCRGCFLVMPTAELLRRPYAEYCLRCESRHARKIGG